MTYEEEHRISNENADLDPALKHPSTPVTEERVNWD
jgi:hypothetical protein